MTSVKRMKSTRKLQLALAPSIASAVPTSRPLYDIKDCVYNYNGFSSDEFGAPFRGREHHKRKKKGRR